MNWRDKHVLVLDDSETMLRLVHYMLSSLGVRAVTTCERSFEAAAAFRRGGIDAAIVDRRLEKADGFAFIRAVRTPSISPEPQLPIVVLTNYASREVVEEAVLAGAHTVLRKPASLRALERHLTYACDRTHRFVRYEDRVIPLPDALAERIGANPNADALRAAVTTHARGGGSSPPLADTPGAQETWFLD